MTIRKTGRIAVVVSQRLLLGLSALLTVTRARFDPALRPLPAAIRALARQLPDRQAAQSLPDFLAELTPAVPDLAHLDPDPLRALIDAVARLDRRHPFGLCLRRSLLRYHFLRRAGLPLGVTFGVRFRQAHETAAGAPPGIAGHAWNTWDGQPWCEREEDYRGFTTIYEWR